MSGRFLILDTEILYNIQVRHMVLMKEVIFNGTMV